MSLTDTGPLDFDGDLSAAAQHRTVHLRE